MIGMTGQPAVRAKGQDDMRTQPCESCHEFADHFVEVGAVELAVWVVQHLAGADSE